MFSCGYGIYKSILFRDMSANVTVLRPQKYVEDVNTVTRFFPREETIISFETC